MRNIKAVTIVVGALILLSGCSTGGGDSSGPTVPHSRSWADSKTAIASAYSLLSKGDFEVACTYLSENGSSSNFGGTAFEEDRCVNFFKTDISQKPYFTEISKNQGSWAVTDKFSFLPAKPQEGSANTVGIQINIISKSGLNEAKAANEKQHQAWEDHHNKNDSPYRYYVNFTNGFNPSAKEAVLRLIWVPSAALGDGGWQFQLPNA